MSQSPLFDQIRQTREWRVSVAMLELTNRIHHFPNQSGDSKSVQQTPLVCEALVRTAGHELETILPEVKQSAKESMGARAVLRKMVGGIGAHQAILEQAHGITELLRILDVKVRSKINPDFEFPDTIPDELVSSEQTPKPEFDTHIRATEVLRAGLRTAKNIGVGNNDRAVRQAANEVFRELEVAAQMAPSEFKNDTSLITALQTDCNESEALQAAHQRNGTPALKALLKTMNVTLPGSDGPPLSR